MASLKKSAIQLVLKAKDALSGKVKKSAESLDYLKGEAADLKEQLGKLKDQKALVTSFEKQSKATYEASKAFKLAQEKVGRLAGEMVRTEKPTKAMKSAIAKARGEVKKANTAYGRQREKLARLRGELTKAGLSSTKLAQQQERLSSEIEETGQAFEKANRKVKETDRALKKDTLKKVAKDAESASSGISRLTKRFAGLIAATAGLYTIKRGIEAILSTGDKFERLSVQLESIMGSAAEGERAFAWIKDFTRNTPFQLEEVSEAFVRLKAFGLDPMDGSMQAIVDQASKLGGGMERLNGITLAVGQAWAKQKLQGEEILQLVERGVPVWELLEKATGKNVQELQKLSSAGKLGRDTIALLIAEIGKSADGAAAKNMSLLSGYVSNLKDSWQQFLAEVADSGALDYVKDTLGSIAVQIEAMNKDGRLKELAKKVSDAFIAMGDAIKSAVAGISFDQFVENAKQSFSVLTRALEGLQTAFTVTGNTVTFFFNSFTVAVKGFATAFLYTIGEISYGWGKLLETVGADSLAEGLLDTTKRLRSMGAEFAKQTAEDANNVKDAISSTYETLFQKNQESQKKVRKESKVTWDAIREEQERYRADVEETGSVAEKSAATTKAAFADAAEALNKINAAETRTELASLGVALAEAFSAGKLSQEEYTAALEASRKKLEDLKREADGAGKGLDRVTASGQKQTAALEDTATIAGVMASHYNNLSNELQGLSGSAHDAFLSMQGVGSVDTSASSDGLSELKSQMEEAKAAASDLQHTFNFDVTGIDKWMNETAANAATVKAQFLEQKIALEELLQSYDQGSISARNFVQEGRLAADSMNLLNDQDLDRLNSAILSAKQNMAQLGDSSKNTLESLQDELDQLQGKQDDIERRRYENQRNELKAQKAEAEADGDQEAIQNLSKALRVSEDIYNERRKQAQIKEREESQKSSPGERTRPTSLIENKTPQKTIRLEYPGGALDVGIAPTDESKLLQALKNAGMRTV